MSRVYFTTRDEGGRELLGRERAHMSMLRTGVATGLLYGVDLDRHLTGEAARELSTTRGRATREDWVRLMLSIGDPVFQYEGEALSSLALTLNTALIVGSDPLCLLARLDGQNEIHAYVEGPNRAWMAGLIREGRARGLCRENMGWEGIAELLESSDAAPVVTSSSFAESFPNPGVADWTAPGDVDQDDDDEAWCALPEGERWDLAMAGLRSNPGKCLELSPENLRAPFDHSLSLFDLAPRAF